jgi:nucleoside-diphosphate-sugar epimerase
MILVTGGAGYVGSVLVPELLDLGDSVRVVDTMWFDAAPQPHPRLEVITGDIREFDPAWLSGVHAVIHLAGLSPLLHVRDAVDAYIFCLGAPQDKVREQIFNVLRKNYRTLELAHWVAEILERHRAVSIQVRRDRSIESAARSYYVVGRKITEQIGFRAERGTTGAVLEMWDALEAGLFGRQPLDNPAFFNIRWFKERCAGLMSAPACASST